MTISKKLPSLALLQLSTLLLANHFCSCVWTCFFGTGTGSFLQATSPDSEEESASELDGESDGGK